ncbi:MAG: CaiB/BaiF CoA-transferase family protein [Vicingaceae bacterium]
MQTFFKKLKVVELASVLAGPSVGQFFAELGAEVLKIENKNLGGDITRTWKLAIEDSDHPYSAYYSSVNYGKKSIFLDLKKERDYKVIESHLKNADVVICNFKPGDDKKLKLDFDSVKQLNPKIIYGEITGFPMSNRLAYDVVLQAESGFLAMSGTSNGELCKMPVALIDVLAAHQLKEGILLSMLQQQINKKAIKVSVSLFDAALAGLVNQASNWLMAKHIAQPMGTLHPNIAPYGELFTCKDDKQLVLAIGTNRQFKSLCKCLKMDAIIYDSRFKDNTDRITNRKELQGMLASKIKSYDRKELIQQFINSDIPAGAVRKMDEVFELNDAQERIISELKEGKKLISIKGNAFKIEE